MDTKIQFRVDEETKHIPHDDWVTEQIHLTFKRLEDNIAQFISNEEVSSQMESFKAKLRARISYEITMD